VFCVQNCSVVVQMEFGQEKKEEGERKSRNLEGSEDEYEDQIPDGYFLEKVKQRGHKTDFISQNTYDQVSYNKDRFSQMLSS